MPDLLSITWPSSTQWLLAAGVLVTAWLVSTLVMVTLKHSKALTRITESTLDDEIIRLLSRPIHLGFQLAGVLIALKYLFPALSYQGFGYETIVPIALITWASYVLNRLIRGIMDWHERSGAEEHAPGVRRGTFGFLNTIVSIMVWGLALAFILNQVGVDVSALIAGLGIAGIAVALALQNTLSGLFSAVGLAIDRPIRQGDYIRLEDGTEGFVEDISMRSTRVRTFEQSLVIIPNSKLTEMVITNAYLPQEEVVLKVTLGVGYNDDLEEAEAIAIRVAEEVMANHGVKGSADPFVRYTAFGDSAIEMKVFMRIERFLDQFVVRHEYIKALTQAFHKAKITIPYPQREIHMHK